MKNLSVMIAEHCAMEGINNSTEGNWIILFEEICQFFEIDLKTLNDMLPDIECQLYNMNCVADVEIDKKNETIDIDFYTGYLGLEPEPQGFND